MKTNRDVLRPKSVGMTDRHRKIIQSNFHVLVQECNLDLLLPRLLQKHVFSSEMVEKYTGSDKIACKRMLFVDIHTRGPDAFYHLVTSLEEIGQDHLANCLTSPVTNGVEEKLFDTLPSNDLPSKTTKAFQLPAANEIKINHSIEEINETDSHSHVIHSTIFHDNLDAKIKCYPTRSKTRGKVLIINNMTFITDVERLGAKIDQQSLLDLFDKMGGFIIDPHENLTHKKMERVIKNFVTSPDLLSVDMCFVFISSHGLANKILTSDEAYISTDWIEEQFNNINCPALVSKPKIIIYQACRGIKLAAEEIRTNVQTDCPDIKLNRAYSDLLISHSTLLGWKSHRDPSRGTWFIEKFCSVFMKHAHDTHVENLLKMVDERISKLRSLQLSSQTSTYHSIGFNSLCYINPGIYEENGILKKF